MPKFNDKWKVGPHGQLEKLDEGLLTVEGEIRMPLGNFPRRMTVVGLTAQRTAIWSSIPLAEPQMREIEALGVPSFLIVPGPGYRLDIRPWTARYPMAKVICAPGARGAVEKAVKVDATSDIWADPSVQLETVPGIAGKEAALLIRREGGTTLVINDLIANVRHPHGIGAHIMARLLGFGVSHPQIPRVGKWMFVKDKKALATAFRKWADEQDLKRIVVSHGDVIADEPRKVLQRVAADLDV
ncbi:hypothetical protein D3227_06390 [Mesorhizobium waimense]|uniref:DUF4336 domain-containing protein n=1 Tax=Mesorhizobium waimense TaxID=1300307 RepID=A0A3A5KXC7_9HYPH|nr:hypothetical protein [Mesorhizobium waimense]RJT41412.1 hypothetical protein D3227_06390 [Mesorhizobium waimense]